VGLEGLANHLIFCLCAAVLQTFQLKIRLTGIILWQRYLSNQADNDSSNLENYKGRLLGPGINQSYFILHSMAHSYKKNSDAANCVHLTWHRAG